MKLRIPTNLRRALLNGMSVCALTCCIQALSAQAELEEVTIPEGQKTTCWPGPGGIEGKSIIVDGTLEITKGTDYSGSFDLTVSKTGYVDYKVNSVGTRDENSVFNININGGRFEQGSWRALCADNSGIVNIFVKDQGVLENSGTLVSTLTEKTASSDTPPSRMRIEVDNATLKNASRIVSGYIYPVSPQNACIDIILKNGAVMESWGLEALGGAEINLDIADSRFTNTYQVLISTEGALEPDAHVFTMVVRDGGLFQNDDRFIIKKGAKGSITLKQGGTLLNNDSFQTSSAAGAEGLSLVVGVDGGRLENCGKIQAADNSTFIVKVTNGGECVNREGVLKSYEGSALIIDVEDGTFTNTATSGNVDVVVGKNGLMSGYGTFGSNDVYGSLVVGSGETGLNNPDAKHQSYSGDLTLHSGAELTFYVEGRDNYSQIFVMGTVSGTNQPGSIRAAVAVSSAAMARSVIKGEAFMNPSYIALADAEGNEIENVSDQLGIEYYGVGPYMNKYYDVDPETGSLLPNTAEIEKALLSGSAELTGTLWSSTGAVRDLSRTALSQVFLPCYNAERTRAEASAAMTGRRPMYCRRPNVWVAGLGGFMNMGGSSAFTYSGGGYAVGADAPVGAYGRVGAAFGQSFGDFSAKHSSNTVDQTGIMFSIYGGFEKPINEKRSHRASAYFGYGVVDNDARTSLMGVESGSANWDDEAFVFGLEYAMDFHVRDNLTVSPFIGIEYAYGSQSGYAESFSGGLVRRYNGATMQYWRIPVGCAVRHSCALGGKQYLVSELALGYIGDVSRHNPHGRVNIEGRDYIIHGSNPARNALMLRAGTNWLINEHWTVGAQYNLEARSRQTSQSVNAYVRYSF